MLVLNEDSNYLSGGRLADELPHGGLGLRGYYPPSVFIIFLLERCLIWIYSTVFTPFEEEDGERVTLFKGISRHMKAKSATLEIYETKVSKT